MGWSWRDLGELIKDLAPAFTAAAAWFAACTARQGLNKWHVETIGKRKAELAEDVLSSFYQMRDIISTIRSPAVSRDENVDRPKVVHNENDCDALKRAKDTYYVPIARYNEHRKLIADLMTKRYRMRAMFGVDAIKPFDILRQVFSTITGSARRLINIVGKPATEKQLETHQIWETHIWWGMGDEDAIDKEVASAIEAIENICRPVLEARK